MSTNLPESASESDWTQVVTVRMLSKSRDVANGKLKSQRDVKPKENQHPSETKAFRASTVIIILSQSTTQ